MPGRTVVQHTEDLVAVLLASGFFDRDLGCFG